jgi:lipoprotein-releasing system permease protein
LILAFVKKYLFSKKNTKAINVISWVSIGAIAIGTAALLMVLSAYNGIDYFVRSMYSSFYTDVKISNSTTTNYDADDTFFEQLQHNKYVQFASKTLEQKVLINYNTNQNIVTLKGVDGNYNKITNFNKYVKYGDTIIDNTEPRIILGIGVSNSLQITEEGMSPVSVYAFNKDANFNTAPQDAYSQVDMYVTGIFAVQEDFDTKYAIANLHNVQTIANQENKISSYEIKLKNEAEADNFIKSITPYLQQNKLAAATKYEQNKTLYYILKSEKWMVFAVLSLMLFIASFNMIGSLSMLVLDKQKDISILKAIGMQDSNIKKIFLSTGLGIGLIGAIIGAVLALILLLVQQHFGVLKMGGGPDMLLDAYPVKLLFSDFILVFTTVCLIAFIASWFPSNKAAKTAALLGLK